MKSQKKLRFSLMMVFLVTVTGCSWNPLILMFGPFDNQADPLLDTPPDISVTTVESIAIPARSTQSLTIQTGTSSVEKKYVVANRGEKPLRLSGSPRVDITGNDALSYVVAVQPSETIYAGESGYFIVRFTSDGSEAWKTCTVTIRNNDPDEGDFSFTLTSRAAK